MQAEALQPASGYIYIYICVCVCVCVCVLVLRCGLAGVVWYPDAG